MDDFLKKMRFLVETDAAELGSVESWCWHHDLPKSTVSAFLNGRAPTVETVFKIAEVLGIKIEINLAGSRFEALTTKSSEG